MIWRCSGIFMFQNININGKKFLAVSDHTANPKSSRVYDSRHYLTHLALFTGVLLSLLHTQIFCNCTPLGYEFDNFYYYNSNTNSTHQLLLSWAWKRYSPVSWRLFLKFESSLCFLNGISASLWMHKLSCGQHLGSPPLKYIGLLSHRLVTAFVNT